MDHNEAERIQAADRYLLGELSVAEREQFEEHFFSCPECAEEVRAGTVLRANARAVFLEEAWQPVGEEREQPRIGWLAWLNLRPVLAGSWAVVCLLLAAISGFQTLVVMPGLRTQLAEVKAPQPYQSFTLRPLSRGDDLVLGVSPASQFVGLAVHLDPRHSFPAYRADILDEAGSLLSSVNSAAPQRLGEPLGFLIPTSSVSPGSYTMVLHGLDSTSQPGPGTEIETFRFVVKHQ